MELRSCNDVSLLFNSIKYMGVNHKDRWIEVSDDATRFNSSPRFPWKNPKNAYMWGAVHGMIIITLLLIAILYILL